jgi:hypothetical protein
MTRQEVFDTVAVALLKQGKPSMTLSGTCLYRAADGSKCAAGHLIPDNEYNDTMERHRASDINSPTLLAIMDDVGPDFMDHIQSAHDGGQMMAGNHDLPEHLVFANPAYEGTAWLSNWKARMRLLAAHYNLDDKVLDA